MGVRILHDAEDGLAALYCSTTTKALDCDTFSTDREKGLDALEVAQRFLGWLDHHKHVDPRSLSARELDDAITEWWGAQDRYGWEHTQRGLSEVTW